MDNLPDDVFFEIIKDFDLNQLKQLCSTSSNIKKLCDSDRVWEKFSRIKFHNKPKFGKNWFDSYWYYNRKVWVVVYNNGYTDTTVEIFNDLDAALKYIWEMYFYRNPIDPRYSYLFDKYQNTGILRDIDEYMDQLGIDTLMQGYMSMKDFEYIYNYQIQKANLNLSDPNILKIFQVYINIRNEYRDIILSPLPGGSISYGSARTISVESKYIQYN